MVDDAAMIMTWNRLTEAFRQGDMATFESAFADQFNGSMNDLAMPRDVFFRAIRQGRQRGWTGQHVVSISARANVLTTHYYNTFNDGTITEGAAVAMFNDDGKIVAIRALTTQPRSIQPIAAEP
ncbi:MAG: hypothetical protein QOJ19_3686 [Acidimicrobiia bacterium]|nr:hypothetical protein [Acidimicrobiia bacterium]